MTLTNQTGADYLRQILRAPFMKCKCYATSRHAKTIQAHRQPRSAQT